MKAASALFTLLLLSCSSAGPYGYSRVYTPLDREEDAVKDAREFDPVMAQRDPENWKKAKISLFGVVNERREANGGGAYLTLGMRTLAPRNLCDEADEESCRVTVSAREHAVVHVIVKLASDDDFGRLSVRPGSLLRVVGHLGEDTDAGDGGPVLRADFYRHWPRGEYVTMADSEHMRR